ncbi:hypothetical protein [Kluyvera sp. CHPC 1.251]|uniref:hypothetical protein n=1 Tax=Kluyvera sp. CHPC 1.251 TaxID=2995175 RepID=UPI002FD7DCA9
MKTLIKTQIRNELIGQGILALLGQKSPISEFALLMQLRKIQNMETDPARHEVLQELIAELSISVKKFMPDAGMIRREDGEDISEEKPGNEKRHHTILHKMNKLH